MDESCLDNLETNEIVGTVTGFKAWTNLRNHNTIGFDLQTTETEILFGHAYYGNEVLNFNAVEGKIKGFFIDSNAEVFGLRVENLVEPCVPCRTYMSGCLKCSSATTCTLT